MVDGEVPVGRTADVELGHVGAHREGAPKRRERVLGESLGGAPVGDHGRRHGTVTAAPCQRDDRVSSR